MRNRRIKDSFCLVKCSSFDMTKKSGWVVAGLAGWWLLPLFYSYLAHDGWRLMTAGLPILVVLFALLFVCFRNRHNEQVFLIWFPLVTISAVVFFRALAALLANYPGAMHSQAPLEGLAIMLMLGIVVATGIALVVCLVSIPRNYSYPISVLTIFNSVAIALVIWLPRQMAGSEQIVVQVLDSKGHPLSGVETHYEVYGYGPGGRRPSSPEIQGGPLLSDKDGHVAFRSKELLHEVEATFHKSEYVPVSINLGMRYKDSDGGRGLLYSVGNLKRVAQSGISTAAPVQFVVYLPKANEITEPLQRFESRTMITNGPSGTRFLRIATGTFSVDPSSDLRFDFFEERDNQGYQRAHLRATALNGAGIVELPRWTTLSLPASSFERVMQMAPENGYEDSIVIQHFAGSAESRIYVHSRDGLYAVMKLDMNYWLGSKNPDHRGSISAEVFVNPTGSRRLLFDPEQELKASR
jgi:hypothetical protein